MQDSGEIQLIADPKTLCGTQQTGSFELFFCFGGRGDFSALSRSKSFSGRIDDDTQIYKTHHFSVLQAFWDEVLSGLPPHGLFGVRILVNPEGIGPLVPAMMDGEMWQISLSSGCFLGEHY